MKPVITFLATGALVVSTSVFAAGPTADEAVIFAPAELPSRAIQNVLDTNLDAWQVFDTPLAEIASALADRGEAILAFGSETFALRLSPSDLWSEDYRQEWHEANGVRVVHTAPTGVYQGQLAGQPASDVRLVATDDLLRGYIRTEEAWYFIDPLTHFTRKAEAGAARAEQVVLYREQDVRAGAAVSCGSGHAHRIAERFVLDPAGLDEVPAQGATRNHNDSLWQADIATDADFEYTSSVADPATEIAGIVNVADGIYEAEHDISFRLRFQGFWNVVNDPYSTNDAEDLLDQFRNYWNANRDDVRRNVAHLFTGRNLAGTTAGIAFTGVVCRFDSFAYGLSEDQGFLALDQRLFAHEVGHNFNALHDNEISAPLVAGCNAGTGEIMCSALQFFGPNTFSAISENAVRGWTNNNNSCLFCQIDDDCELDCRLEWIDCVISAGPDDFDREQCHEELDDCELDCCQH